MKKLPIVTIFSLTSLLFLFSTTRLVFAGTSYTITGENYTVGDTLNLTITSHDECLSDVQLIEVAVRTWGGSPSGYAVDFSQAAISATLNGVQLNGTRRYLIHPSKMDNAITMQLPSPILFKKTGDTIKVMVTGAKRIFPQNGAYQLHLLEQPTDAISYSGCGPQPSIGTHYVDQAAEQRKAEGLPTEELPDSVTVVGSTKPTAVPTFSPSITAVETPTVEKVSASPAVLHANSTQAISSTTSWSEYPSLVLQLADAVHIITSVIKLIVFF
jgi:hypothetical protein